MKAKNSKFPKSKLYKGVYFNMIEGKYPCWQASGSINGIRFIIHTDNERDAALKYDMKMIEKGKEPVNILVRK